jgi:hypothetical protein
VNRYLISLLTFLILIFSLFSQDNEDISEIEKFYGGKHYIKSSLYSSYFLGQTTRSRNFGNTISGGLYDTHLVASNPAALTKSKKNTMTVDISPGFSLDVLDYYTGFTDDVDNSIIRNFKGSNFKAADDERRLFNAQRGRTGNELDYYDYEVPEFSSSLGQSGWINQFGMIVHDDKYGSFGFNWHRPLYVDLSFIGNDVEFLATNKSNLFKGTLKDFLEDPDWGNLTSDDYDLFFDENDEFDWRLVTDDRINENWKLDGLKLADDFILDQETLVPLTADFLGAVNISMHEADFGYGKEIFDTWSVGAALNISHINLDVTGRTHINGFIHQVGRKNGDDFYEFLGRAEDNKEKLNVNMDSNFQGSLLGMVFSTNYSPSERWSFDIAFDTPREKKLSGSFNITTYNLDDLNIGSDSGVLDTGEIEDSVNIKKTNLYCDYMKMYIPGKFAFGTTYIGKEFIYILSVEKYIGDMKLNYTYTEEITKEYELENPDYKPNRIGKFQSVGMSPQYAVKLAFGCDHFSMSASCLLVQIIRYNTWDRDIDKPDNIWWKKHVPNPKGSDYDNQKGSNFTSYRSGIIPIPSLSLGTSFKLSENTRADIGLITLPNPFLRTGFTWNF